MKKTTPPKSVWLKIEHVKPTDFNGLFHPALPYKKVKKAKKK